MGNFQITVEPNTVTVGDTSFQMQGDPSASKAWRTLLEQKIDYTDEAFRDSLLDALCDMAETPDDADTLRSLQPGAATLRKIADWYVKEVTGFPTQPQSSSTRSSKKT